MARRRYDKAGAWLLLTVFLFGGLLAPVLHRMHHGLTSAELLGGPDTATECDHTQHGTSFEHDFSTLLVDQCPQCQRPVDTLPFQQTVVATLPADALVLENATAILSSRPFAALLIRGPPGQS